MTYDLLIKGGHVLDPGQAVDAQLHTLKAGQSYSPRWGTHPWGWLPARA